eukprot:7139613-Pyramimonas_sp.AAC.2
MDPRRWDIETLGSVECVEKTQWMREPSSRGTIKWNTGVGHVTHGRIQPGFSFKQRGSPNSSNLRTY